MGEALVYISAVGFLVLIFPIHIGNYIYVNTEEKYASLNVGIFNFYFYNFNTQKDGYGLQYVGKKLRNNNGQSSGRQNNSNVSLYKIFNTLCLYKIIQLSDFGIKKETNAYAALVQNAATTAIYKFIQVNGNYCKLRNYTVLNEEHSEIRYYAKAVTIINLTVIAKIILIIIREKIYAHKNKKRQG